MIVVVDRRARMRSISLRERILAEGVPCALCAPETLCAFGAAVTVCFAAHEDDVSRVSLRAWKTALIAVNVSGRRMYHQDAVIWDEQTHGELAGFVLQTAAERTGLDLGHIVAGDVKVERDAAYFRLRYLRLTEVERLILFHLACRPDEFCAEREVRRFVCPAGDLRLGRSSVAVHVSHINAKAVRATGDKMIACRRNHGYAILTSPPPKPNTRDKPGFVPPFS